ncbi:MULTISPECIES: hypothetical protein [Enterobacteriaceae]|uniref:hypothetical protein n=1 Tax=Enterobacteriaceae TaxID=543 RepID=UPI0004D1C823|nr:MULTISPECIES: hypothetical protein [Enterobacteriaceae]QLW09435.1 hypothetical protein HV159_00970 [Escherichia coli]BEM63569.1 hypothetical protein SME23J_25960 [Serratia marcescens]HCM9437087.1 hypothetical protein [Enterobacter hormaechei subsp. xiangfangensis]AIE71152.1 hypothetical protein HR38_22690 [Klebsiella michiganensis]ELT9740526.1 hypothetical protein [Klebsiella michiganensis]
MNIEEMYKELEKLKYHVRILGDTIDYQAHPVESLILSMDWNEADINSAHDIFEKYDRKIENKEDIEWSEFEHELRNKFNIGYQTVKQIVISFFNNHQWTDVCYGYAMSFEPYTPVEFHQITRTNK